MSTATLLREAAQIQSSLMSQIGRNVYVLTSLPRVGKKILLKLCISREYFLVEKAPDGLPDELLVWGLVKSCRCGW